jgi:hypothetical protein
MKPRLPFFQLLCSALLILPTGWCCQEFGWLNSLSALLQNNAYLSTSKAAHTGCKHCPPQSRTDNSSPGKELPRDKGNCPSWCCDDDRAATPQKTIQIDAAPVLFLGIVPATSAVTPTATTTAGIDVPPISPSLQILNCVWLC